MPKSDPYILWLNAKIAINDKNWDDAKTVAIQWSHHKLQQIRLLHAHDIYRQYLSSKDNPIIPGEAEAHITFSVDPCGVNGKQIVKDILKVFDGHPATHDVVVAVMEKLYEPTKKKEGN